VLATTNLDDQMAVPVSDSRILRPLRLVAASLVALVSLTVFASAASAQSTDCSVPRYGGTLPTVCGTQQTPPAPTTPETTSPTVLGATQSRFAMTGGDMVGLAAIGGGAAAIGAALVLAARRRRALDLA
jgi:hypothetical protein